MSFSAVTCDQAIFFRLSRLVIGYSENFWNLGLSQTREKFGSSRPKNYTQVNEWVIEKESW